MKTRIATTILLAAGLVLSPAIAEAQSKRTARYDAWVAQLPAEGAAPTKEYAVEVAKAYLRKVLKDPDSAQYELEKIEQGSWRAAFERFGTPGWLAHIQVNAKNSYGGYTGFQPYVFVFRSGYLVEVYSTEGSKNPWWVAHLGMKTPPIPPLPSYQATPSE